MARLLHGFCYTELQKIQKTRKIIHVSSGIQTHSPSVSAIPAMKILHHTAINSYFVFSWFLSVRWKMCMKLEQKWLTTSVCPFIASMILLRKRWMLLN